MKAAATELSLETNRQPIRKWSATANRTKILFVSVAMMSVITVCTGTIATILLYSASFEQQRQRLIETGNSQARLIEAVARFDRQNVQPAFQGQAAAATISQIVDAHQHQSGLGQTGEFTLARLENNQIVYLLERRHVDPGQSQKIPFANSTLAEPMRLALSGESGTIVATDYRGELVLAAYEPVGELDLGIVAKIDLAEIRQPFVRASMYGLGVASALILTGSLILVWINTPLIKRVEDRERNLDAVVSNVVDAIFTIDESGMVLSFNQAAERIFGYAADDIIGQNVQRLVDTDAAGGKAKNDNNASPDKESRIDFHRLSGRRHELKGRRKNGDVFSMDVAINPMTWDESERFVAIARDITQRKQMEQELRRANFLSDIALDLTDCGYWHVDYSDPDYYFQSERSARMLGEPLKPDGRYHLQDEWFARLLEANPETAELTSERYQGAIDGRYEKYESTYAYKRPLDGKIIWLHALGKVVRDDDGNIQFMYGAYQDITERKQAELEMRQAQEEIRASEERFRGYFEHGQIGMAVTSPDLGWIEANSELQQMLGYDLNELRNLSWAEITHPEDLQADLDQFERLLAGEIENYRMDKRFIRKDGNLVYTNMAVTGVRNESGRVAMVLTSLMDITQRKTAELEMQQARRAAEKAKLAAESANRAKSDFLSHMSHELRTPLNGILGYAQILQRDHSITGPQRDSLGAIINCGDHLLALINDILDLSKIEAGKLEVDQADCDLHRLLKAVSEIVRERANRKGLEFNMDVATDMPRGIVTDAAKLRQILVNLLGNAVKFTKQGKVELHATENPRGQLRFDIVDTGVGMNEQEIKLIFDPFKQVEAGKAAGGTGLGLAITRRLCEALGATINVESKKGIGTTFTVVLPLIEAEMKSWPDDATSAKPQQTFVLPSQHDFTILVADDRDTNRHVLHRMLESAGFKVRLACDGDQALDELRQHKDIDLVLMDVRMPRVSGIEALQEIRKDPQLKSLKVIAVTASVFPEFRQKAIESGFDDFLPKPFRVEELMAKLQQLLQFQFQSSEELQPERPEPGTGARSQMVNLSAEILTQLRDALRIKNLTALTSLGTELVQTSTTQLLGQQILEHITNFEFAELEDLLNEAKRDDQQ